MPEVRGQRGGYGGYAEKFITPVAPSYSYTIGAGGAATTSYGYSGGPTTIAGMFCEGGKGGSVLTTYVVYYSGGFSETYNVYGMGGQSSGGDIPTAFVHPGRQQSLSSPNGAYGAGGWGGPNWWTPGGNGGHGYIEIWEFG